MNGPSPPATGGGAGADAECSEVFTGEAALAKDCKVRWEKCEDRRKNR